LRHRAPLNCAFEQADRYSIETSVWHRWPPRRNSPE
jgi:hypothetical protein